MAGSYCQIFAFIVAKAADRVSPQSPCLLRVASRTEANQREPRFAIKLPLEVTR